MHNLSFKFSSTGHTLPGCEVVLDSRSSIVESEPQELHCELRLLGRESTLASLLHGSSCHASRWIWSTCYAEQPVAFDFPYQQSVDMSEAASWIYYQEGDLFIIGLRLVHLALRSLLWHLCAPAFLMQSYNCCTTLFFFFSPLYCFHMFELLVKCMCFSTAECTDFFWKRLPESTWRLRALYQSLH